MDIPEFKKKDILVLFPIFVITFYYCGQSFGYLWFGIDEKISIYKTIFLTTYPVFFWAFIFSFISYKNWLKIIIFGLIPVSLYCLLYTKGIILDNLGNLDLFIKNLYNFLFLFAIIIFLILGSFFGYIIKKVIINKKFIFFK